MARRPTARRALPQRFPYRTLIIALFLLGAIAILAVIIIPPPQPETVDINGCKFPPNPVIGSKVDFETHITKNEGFFKGSGQPVLLDYVPEQGRLEQMRTGTLCLIKVLHPDVSDDRALCLVKTVLLPPNPTDSQLADAQKYCLESEQQTTAGIEAYKSHHGMLGNLQTLLRNDPAAKFNLSLAPQNAHELTNMWIRRTAVLGDYADLLGKICDDPVNSCLSCDIRRIEGRASITLNGPTEACQHPSGGEYLRCAIASDSDQGTQAKVGDSAIPSCESWE